MSEIYNRINNNVNNNDFIPEIVFIIPYRDREEHKHFFQRQMDYLMEDVSKQTYKIYFIHQKDDRSFNRGAMKNIGFLAMCKKYPNDYKNIIFVFHDVDTLPYKKNIIDYKTTPGIVKHYYGYTFALGGIFSIMGSDFEKTGGFPNFWAWGGEDNIIQKRVQKCGLYIDRSSFFQIGNRNILQFADGFLKTINRNELGTIEQDNSYEYYNTIKNIQYSFNNEYIDVISFDTNISYDFVKNNFESHNISKGNNRIRLKKKRQTSKSFGSLYGLHNKQKISIF